MTITSKKLLSLIVLFTALIVFGATNVDAASKPARAKITKVTKSHATRFIRIKWKKVKGADKYKVLVKNNKGKFIVKKFTKKRFFTRRYAWGKYKFKVCAVKDKVKGKFSKVKTVKIKKPKEGSTVYAWIPGKYSGKVKDYYSDRDSFVNVTFSGKTSSGLMIGYTDCDSYEKLSIGEDWCSAYHTDWGYGSIMSSFRAATSIHIRKSGYAAYWRADGTEPHKGQKDLTKPYPGVKADMKVRGTVKYGDGKKIVPKDLYPYHLVSPGDHTLHGDTECWTKIYKGKKVVFELYYRDKDND